MDMVPNFSYKGLCGNAFLKDSATSFGRKDAINPWDTTLLSLLERAAQRQPHNGLTFRDQKAEDGCVYYSYQCLMDRVKVNSAILSRSNVIKSREPVLITFERYQDSIIWYWSVIAAGGIPALLPPKRGGSESWNIELQHISELLNEPVTLTDKASADQFMTAGKFKVTCLEDIVTSNESGDEHLQRHCRWSVHRANLGGLDDTCTILFTSGSTGPSKAVCYSHRQLLISSYLKCYANNMNHNDRFLCWISFDHSVALCELHLHAMEAAASMVVIPRTELTQDPIKFWRVLSDEKISYTFAPNSFLAAALRAHNDAEVRGGNGSEFAYNFQQLKVIVCGGEANKTCTLEAAMNFLSKYGAPANAVTAVYGLSETCSALFYNRNSPAYDIQRKNNFASVGVPLPGHKIRIVNGPNYYTCANSVQGSVQISGPMIFKRYYNNIGATEACNSSDGWFDTGDLGSLNELGSLVISGRTKDVLILNGQNYSCGDLEYAIENCGIDGLEPGYTVSFSVWQEKGDTEEVVILFNPSDDHTEDSPRLRSLVEEITKAVACFCKARPHLVVPLPRRTLPRSSIGKLSRAKLRSSFLSGEFDEFKLKLPPPGDTNCSFTEPRQAAIARVFSECLSIPQSSLSPDLPIETLGIDSLSLLKLLSGIERALSLTKPISLRETLSCNTIRKMDAMIGQASDETYAVPYVPVEVLNPTGSKTPLILCHTGNGGFLNYLGLLPLVPDRRILALHAPAPETQQEPFASLSQMLDTYVEAIKGHQPSGPYAIFGFCFGGVLAFEIAKRLEAVGDEVLFCGGLDSPVDISVMRDSGFSRDTVDERHHLMSLLLSVNLIRRDEVPVLLAKLGATSRQDVVKELTSIITQAALEDSGLSEGKLHSWVTMSADIHRIALDYRPGGSVRSFDAFYAASPPIGANVPDAARWRYVYIGEWKNYVIGASNNDVCYDYEEMISEHRSGQPLRLHCVPGTHETMTTPQNIHALGKKINDMLLLREDKWVSMKVQLAI